MEEPGKVGLKSMGIAEEKREQLRAIFPEVFSEGKIDFDQLRRVLGEWIDSGRERFGLNWPKKADCMKIIQQPSIATLKPARKESVNFDETKNLFIEGDNLEVLKLLQKAYYGKVKMIYIDPPYNTGKEFIYPDKYAETLETYLEYTGQKDGNGNRFFTNTDTNGRYHSRWLNMIYPRLYLAKNLLREDGVIFISIDDHEASNLKAICDQIFGEENFISQVVWEKIYTTKNDSANLSDCHEYILCYARNTDLKPIGILPRTEEMDARYKNIDNDPRGPWKSIPLYAKGERKGGRYAIKSPSGKEYVPGPNQHWLYREDVVKELIEDNRIYFGKDGGSQPNVKRFLTEVQQGAKAKTIWKHGDVGSNDSAKREVSGLFVNKPVPFDFPKPTGLVRRMLQLATEANEGDIVLDFFSGSGTTGHAVMLSNLEDGGNRRFILVQIPEKTTEDSLAYQAGFHNIADVCVDRIRRASDKIKETKNGQIDVNGNGDLDLGFKIFKLDRSTFKVWEGDISENSLDDPKNIANQLEMHVNHIVESSTPEDILYELLLKSGYPLDTKVGKIQLAGREIFSVDGGMLLICLDRDLTQDVIDAMAGTTPQQVICLDEGFKGDDQLKANAVQTFKSHAQQQESEIVFRTA